MYDIEKVFIYLICGMLILAYQHNINIIYSISAGTFGGMALAYYISYRQDVKKMRARIKYYSENQEK